MNRRLPVRWWQRPQFWAYNPAFDLGSAAATLWRIYELMGDDVALRRDVRTEATPKR